jgi:prophage regulatory protein
MKILKAKEVAEKTSFSTAHLRRLAKENKFPKPVQISENRSGWVEEDVNKWIESCIRHQFSKRKS